ncbi:hypothetical protein CR165_22365 [Pseudoroseomonas aestuarii]|uniref:MPN domain-containing protein n=2 Tax=Teichococcus aestuarii TaxID=568898 RepID=A0A2U1UY70_9PROT|nr:hypothetical protein CR165_22365 [Pseudoroseomonas aestuarii]
MRLARDLARLRWDRSAKRPAHHPPPSVQRFSGFAEDTAAIQRSADQTSSSPLRRSKADWIGRSPDLPPGPRSALPFPEGTGPHGHRGRMRQKLLERGPDALADYELLEMLLFFAFKQGDTKPLAKALINRHGSLAKVLTASEKELAETSGLGAPSIAALKLVQATALRLACSERMEQPVLNSWDRLTTYLGTALAGETTAQFRILFLDSKNRLIADEAQAGDAANPMPVDPRAVMKRALELHATALILVHHHPDGRPTPGQADRKMIAEIQAAGAILSVVLHDHLIVGKGRTLSLRREGLL